MLSSQMTAEEEEAVMKELDEIEREQQALMVKEEGEEDAVPVSPRPSICSAMVSHADPLDFAPVLQITNMPDAPSAEPVTKVPIEPESAAPPRAAAQKEPQREAMLA